MGSKPEMLMLPDIVVAVAVSSSAPSSIQIQIQPPDAARCWCYPGCRVLRSLIFLRLPSVRAKRVSIALAKISVFDRVNYLGTGAEGKKTRNQPGHQQRKVKVKVYPRRPRKTIQKSRGAGDRRRTGTHPPRVQPKNKGPRAEERGGGGHLAWTGSPVDAKLLVPSV